MQMVKKPPKDRHSVMLTWSTRGACGSCRSHGSNAALGAGGAWKNHTIGSASDAQQRPTPRVASPQGHAIKATIELRQKHWRAESWPCTGLVGAQLAGEDATRLHSSTTPCLSLLWQGVTCGSRDAVASPGPPGAPAGPGPPGAPAGPAGPTGPGPPGGPTIEGRNKKKL